MYALHFAYWAYRIQYPTREYTAFQNNLNTRGVVSDIADSLVSYKLKNGYFPPAESNIVEMLIMTGGRIENCPHSDSQFLDRFGSVISYSLVGTNATLTSPGTDRIMGTDDDILLRVEIDAL